MFIFQQMEYTSSLTDTSSLDPGVVYKWIIGGGFLLCCGLWIIGAICKLCCSKFCDSFCSSCGTDIEQNTVQESDPLMGSHKHSWERVSCSCSGGNTGVWNPNYYGLGMGVYEHQQCGSCGGSGFSHYACRCGARS